jgi:hypothetical protein
LCEVNEFRLKKHTIQFGILFLPFLVLAQLWRQYLLSQMLCGLTKRAVSLLKPSKQWQEQKTFWGISCNDFYTLISNNPKLLQEIR